MTLLEMFDAIRVYPNPTIMQYAELASKSDDNFVRAIVTMQRKWYCWPGDDAEHRQVIAQMGMSEVIPIRLYGLPNASCKIEITDTIKTLPTADFDTDFVIENIKRFIARQRLFKQFSVVAAF